jgi:hypothetical protein
MQDQDKYCLAPLTMWSANRRGVRLYSHATKRITVASAQLFQLLRQAPLEHFRSLDEHVHELVRIKQNPDRLIDQLPSRAAPDQVRSELRRALDEMVQQGLLISEKDVAGLLSQVASQKPFEPIRSICVTTLNQPDALDACITTSSDNARNHGHQLEYIVLDDSRSSSREPDIAGQLRARMAPCSLAYVQSYHLDEYCRTLAAHAGVDRRIVNFGLMPDERLRRTDGGSKNALMLDAAGERYLQVDDDIQWRLGTAAPPLSGLRVYAGLEPMQTRYFQSRDAVFASANWKEVDFIGSHGAVLGRRLSGLAAPAIASDQLTFAGPVAQILPSLMSGQPAVVRATFTGLAGDPATEFPSYRMLLEESRAGLVTTAGDYAALRLTREVIRVAPELTIMRP